MVIAHKISASRIQITYLRVVLLGTGVLIHSNFQLLKYNMFEVVVQNFQNSGILDRSCSCIVTLTLDILDLRQLNLNALEN